MNEVTVFVLDGLGFRFVPATQLSPADFIGTRAAILVDGEPWDVCGMSAIRPRDLKETTEYVRHAVDLKARIARTVKGAA